jgi:hypothetical protein
MRYLKVICFGLVLFVFTATSSAVEHKLVSLVALLADPSKYDGRDIIVFGYLCNDGVGRFGLFLTKIDCKEVNYSNAIKLNVQNLEKELPKRPSLLGVTGKFKDWSGLVHTDEPFQWGFIDVINMHGRDLP